MSPPLPPGGLLNSVFITGAVVTSPRRSRMLLLCYNYRINSFLRGAKFTVVGGVCVFEGDVKLNTCVIMLVKKWERKNNSLRNQRSTKHPFIFLGYIVHIEK